jgi:hypothetical protein
MKYKVKKKNLNKLMNYLRKDTKNLNNEREHIKRNK